MPGRRRRRVEPGAAPVRRGGYTVVMDDWTYAPPPGLPPILYEDKDLVVVAKPSGLLSVPGRSHPDSALRRLEAARGAAVYPAHRLDLDTSGALAFATRRKAERALMGQFRARTVAKTYLARVAGQPPPEFVVNAPLERIPGQPRSRVSAKGRRAVTRGVVLSRDATSALVQLHPETGRSHQLRVHLLHLGHPIVGDRFYAPADLIAAADRLLLHAWRLTVDQPYSGARLTVVAPPPPALTPPSGVPPGAAIGERSG